MGRISYNIDNGLYTGVVDTKSDLSLHIGRALIFEEELSNGTHTLELKVDTQTSGTSTEIVFFNFLVN